jgi:hypothetical protein
MSDKLIEEFFNSFFSKIDLKDLLKKTYLDGFDNINDYITYGDMIIMPNKRKTND